jgi:iron(III) transport system substrate-binding protein
MKNKMFYLLGLLLLLASCSQDKEQVVVYCSLDKIYSEPVFRSFEKETGIRVKAVYDMELNKTVGLVNRILAESERPQCDVFWNNEISRTIMLMNKGLLTPYFSPGAADIPPAYKDSNGFWTGFAARARVIIYNKELLQGRELPASILDLADPRWKGKAAIAYPLFGTTATHAAILFSEYGDQWALNFFESVKANDCGILDGNATVRDRVVSGDYWWGFTDTDDANGAIADGKNVGIILPDQCPDCMGMPVIPNTIALIKGAPHPGNGKRLIDFVLLRETERRLAFARSAQIPVRKGIETPGNVIVLDSVKQMQVDYRKVCSRLNESAKMLSEVFIK